TAVLGCLASAGQPVLMPSQLSGTSQSPCEARQVTEEGEGSHCPATPEHTSWLQVAADREHSLLGSVPAVTAAQVPSAAPVSAIAQDSQSPSQAVSQQIASSAGQKPLWQLSPTVQGSPATPCGAQLPASHQ